LKQTQPETVSRLKDKTATTAVFVPRMRGLQETLVQLKTRAAGRWDRGRLTEMMKMKRKHAPSVTWITTLALLLSMCASLTFSQRTAAQSSDLPASQRSKRDQVGLD